MLVAVPVSSRKTNRGGSMKRCQVRHRRRLPATSGRSQRLFFNAAGRSGGARCGSSRAQHAFPQRRANSAWSSASVTNRRKSAWWGPSFTSKTSRRLAGSSCRARPHARSSPAGPWTSVPACRHLGWSQPLLSNRRRGFHAIGIGSSEETRSRWDAAQAGWRAGCHPSEQPRSRPGQTAYRSSTRLRTHLE
jgi:hypothetical protein